MEAGKEEKIQTQVETYSTFREMQLHSKVSRKTLSLSSAF